MDFKMTSPLTEDAAVATMETVMKNIYTSCDPDNTNSVSVSKIIDFITPYMLEDLSALESLKSALDPTSNNVCIGSESFYNIMNEWIKTISNLEVEDDQFNTTPSHLDVVDEKQLPYTQSTPRASFGQKLLCCEGLLNLSNASSYSLSTSTQTKENSTAGLEKTILEEEIKKLEHHLNKLSNEMLMVRLQLTSTEEQNDILQMDLDRCKTRLHSEQQVIEHLQNDKRYNDELREELNLSKKQIEELTKKLLQCEKDNTHLYSLIEQTEKENGNLESRCEELSRREQEAKKEIIDIKTELDLKDQEISTIIKVNDEMKNKLNQQKDLIDQLSNENELLNHKKISLEKALRENVSARRESLVSHYKTCLADSSSFPNLDQSSEEECYFKIQDTESKSFLCESLSLHSEISQLAHEKDARYSFGSQFDYNEKQISNIILDNNQNLNDNFAIYEKEINQLKMEDDNVRAKLNVVNEDNVILREELREIKEKVSHLEQDIENLIAEKTEQDQHLEKIKQEKLEIEIELKRLKEKNSILQDENNNLVEYNKNNNNILESKSKSIVDLNEKLLDLKKEIVNLQIDNVSKERELCEFRNKFDFEAAFKNLQIELNERNKEIAEITKSNEDFQERLSKLTGTNQELQRTLKETKLSLQEHQEKSQQMMMLNENIEETASQVQFHINQKSAMISELVELNNQFKTKIESLQRDLKTKVKEVTDLRDSLEKDARIKRTMWRDNKDLSLKLTAQCDTNKKLHEELETVKDELKKGGEAYSDLLVKHNEEVDNSKKLCEQLVTEKEELSSILSKYNEEISKNQKLTDQIRDITQETNSLKLELDNCKETFLEKMSDYENTNENFASKLTQLESENLNLKIELEAKQKLKPEKFFDIAPSEIKNRSFEKQKMSIDRLKEKLEQATLQLKSERAKCEQLRREVCEKNNLEEKYTNLQQEFERSQNMINDLSDKLKSQEEEYKRFVQLSNEKENVLSSKLSQIEEQNKHLFGELTSKDFIINNIVIENETNKNFLANADRKSHEYSSRLSACVLHVNEQDKKIQSLHKEIIEKNIKSETLTTRVGELETQLSKVRQELSEKADIIVTLENQNKSLQNMLSADLNREDLMEVEMKLKNSKRLLQCSEMELSLVKKKILDAKEEHKICSTEISHRQDIILNARNELNRVSSLALRKWCYDLGEDDTYQLLNMKATEISEEGEGLLLLNDGIKLAVSLMEILANKAPRSMEDCSGLANTDGNQPSDAKTIKKFTLRPPRLVVSRPVSPDSPSLDIDEDNLIKIQDDSDASRKYVQQNSDYQDSPCNNEDSYRTASDELSFSHSRFELMTEAGFPSITDGFLEKLGLLESSPKQILSKEETERHFTTLAIQIALDSKDIKERLQNQKELCTEEYEKFSSILRDISSRLRDHKCIGATDSINAVFVLLEDLKFFLKDITQSIGQYGILTCENRMMKCWNLVTNYMALLKQEVIKSELGAAVVNESPRAVNADKSLKKRMHGSKSDKATKQGEKSVVPKQSMKSIWARSKLPSMGRISIAMIVFVVFFILILIILVHWQCRLSVSENQVCVLDDFIKKIQVGNPPY